MGGGVEVVVGGEDSEVVKVVCGTAVISVRILELTEVVQCGDLFQCQLGTVHKCGRARIEEMMTWRAINGTAKIMGRRKRTWYAIPALLSLNPLLTLSITHPPSPHPRTDLHHSPKS